MKNTFFLLGIGGIIVIGLCYFTPLLPTVLAALGLTQLIPILQNDSVLLPLLAIFVVVTGFSLA